MNSGALAERLTRTERGPRTIILTARDRCQELPVVEAGAARLGTDGELISRNLGRPDGDGRIEMRRRVVCMPAVSWLEGEISAEGRG